MQCFVHYSCHSDGISEITGGRKSWDELYFLPKDFDVVRAKLMNLKPEDMDAYIVERKQFVLSNERVSLLFPSDHSIHEFPGRGLLPIVV